MKFKIYYLLALVSFSASSQIVDVANGTRFNYMVVNEVKTETISGNPYISIVYQPATITGFKGMTPPMRYHAQKDEMEFVKEGKMYYMIKSDSVEVRVGGVYYRYLDHQIKGGVKQGFLAVLYDDDKKYSIYRKEEVALDKGAEATSSYGTDRAPSYRRLSDRYYLGVPGKIVFMPTKKKELLALFPDNGSAIEEYLKKNKTSFDNENDLIKLVKFLNSI